MPDTIKVLAIDGGGIKGIIPAMVLAKIEELTNKPIAETFNLIAGTSSGGITALFLSCPDQFNKPLYRAEELVRLYEEEGKDIFNQSLFQMIVTLNSLAAPKYTPDNLKKVLRTYFGDRRLQDSLTNLIIPAYELEERLAFFFKSIKSKLRSDCDFYMRDVALATSAAPTYFPPVQLKTCDHSRNVALIDGGVYANNPAMCAYVEATTMFPYAKRTLLVSLGTGLFTKPLHYADVKEWGLASWARPVLDIAFDGISDTVDYQLKNLLPPAQEGSLFYYRFQTKLDEGDDKIDNVTTENIKKLKSRAEEILINEEDRLKRLAEQLIQ
jgi:uncharacterized protein